jgi:hypothetical protein
MEEMLEDKMSENIATEENAPVSEENTDTGVENTEEDYAALIERDLEVLRNAIPGLEGIRDISELENPVRYGALRDLGLSPEEAFRATTTSGRRPRPDNRAHLRSSAPRAVHAPESNISYRELEIARELFSGISDTEIQRLYKKVTR